MKIYTIIFGMLFMNTVAQSQISISTDSLNIDIVSGDTIKYDTIAFSNWALPVIYVHNNSGSSQNWKVTRKNISQPTDWFNYLCWGTMCYAVSNDNPWVTPLEANTANNEYEKLKVYIGAPSQGSGHYRYYISEDGTNYLDSVDVMINVEENLSVQDYDQIDISLYPNPANNIINISELDPNCAIVIYDMYGRAVEEIKHPTSSTIDISTLDAGQYIFVLKNDNQDVFYKKKIIVNK